eukprot:6190239-Pleurochrysis_carterae.AAC.3
MRFRAAAVHAPGRMRVPVSVCWSRMCGRAFCAQAGAYAIELEEVEEEEDDEAKGFRHGRSQFRHAAAFACASTLADVHAHARSMDTHARTRECTRLRNNNETSAQHA